MGQAAMKLTIEQRHRRTLDRLAQVRRLNATLRRQNEEMRLRLSKWGRPSKVEIIHRILEGPQLPI